MGFFFLRILSIQRSPFISHTESCTTITVDRLCLSYVNYAVTYHYILCIPVGLFFLFFCKFPFVGPFLYDSLFFFLFLFFLFCPFLLFRFFSSVCFFSFLWSVYFLVFFFLYFSLSVSFLVGACFFS